MTGLLKEKKKRDGVLTRIKLSDLQRRKRTRSCARAPESAAIIEDIHKAAAGFCR